MGRSGCAASGLNRRSRVMPEAYRPENLNGNLEMKLVLSIVLALSLVVASFAQHRPHRTNAPSSRMPRLRQELLKRVAEDQRIRNELIKKGIDHPDPALLDQMKRIDAVNTARIKVIIKQYGWPGPKLIGRDGTDAFFLLAQHGDPAFQKKVLPLVQKAYRRGILTGQNYALFTDRVFVASGKPQIYGTAARPIDQWNGREPVFDPIEDEANVDKRRAKVGLMPLSEYREFLKQLYFPQEKPKPFPVGDYQYTGYDKNHKKAVEGQL